MLIYYVLVFIVWLSSKTVAIVEKHLCKPVYAVLAAWEKQTPDVFEDVPKGQRHKSFSRDVLSACSSPIVFVIYGVLGFYNGELVHSFVIQNEVLCCLSLGFVLGVSSLTQALVFFELRFGLWLGCLLVLVSIFAYPVFWFSFFAAFKMGSFPSLLLIQLYIVLGGLYPLFKIGLLQKKRYRLRCMLHGFHTELAHEVQMAMLRDVWHSHPPLREDKAQFWALSLASMKWDLAKFEFKDLHLLRVLTNLKNHDDIPTRRTKLQKLPLCVPPFFPSVGGLVGGHEDFQKAQLHLLSYNMAGPVNRLRNDLCVVFVEPEKIHFPDDEERQMTFDVPMDDVEKMRALGAESLLQPKSTSTVKTAHHLFIWIKRHDYAGAMYLGTFQVLTAVSTEKEFLQLEVVCENKVRKYIDMIMDVSKEPMMTNQDLSNT